jgi:hypothetical protein
LASPPPIEIAFEPTLLRPLDRGTVIVRVRSREYAPLVSTLDGDPVRLLPDREAGVFRGTFTARANPGRSTVEVRTATGEPPLASRSVIVRSDARVLTAAAPLAMLASAHRGINVTPDRLADLTRLVQASVAAPTTTVVRRPMRSAWWLVPFAGCLSTEWWLRRRRGLR